MPFKIKICGITSPADAKLAVEFGADAIGLNFYSRSLRSVTATKAKEIAENLNDAHVVGVFVNESADTINQLVQSVGLDFVQLHGDEPTELVSAIDAKIIKVIRIMDQNFDAVIEIANQWKAAGAKAVLLDAGSKADYGGTGKQLDWRAITALRTELPLLLAGGLNCDNVAHAISIAKPHGVDVASGIEKFPGSKDVETMRKFVESAAKAFAAADSSQYDSGR